MSNCVISHRWGIFYVILQGYREGDSLIVYSNPAHGTAYAMEDGALICTPLQWGDLTYDTDTSNWVEVDMECAEAEGRNPEGIALFLNRCEDMACFYDC